MNRVEVRGGVTRDAEITYLPSGDPLLEFSVALNGTRWSSEAKAQVVKTTYVRVNAYSQVAIDLIDAGGVNQGDDIYVLGELDQHEYEKRDGTKESKTRITAFHATVVRRRKPPQQTQEPSTAKTPW